MPDDAYIEDMTGLYLPRPTLRQIRRMVFGTGQGLEIQESASEIKDALRHLDENKDRWLVLHEPTFGTEVHIARAALSGLQNIEEAWKDMEAVRQMVSQQQMASRMGAAGIQGPGGPPVPLEILQQSDSRAVRRARGGR